MKQILISIKLQNSTFILVYSYILFLDSRDL